MPTTRQLIPWRQHPATCASHPTCQAMYRIALPTVPKCFHSCRDMPCTLPRRPQLESPAQLGADSCQNPRKQAACHPPESLGCGTEYLRSIVTPISATAAKVHAQDTCPDALHRRQAVNAQQATPSSVRAAKVRSQKQDQKTAQKLSRRTVPQTVCGTVLVVSFWGR